MQSQGQREPVEVLKQATEAIARLEMDIIKRADSAIREDRLAPFAVAQALILQGTQLLVCMACDNGLDAEKTGQLYDDVTGHIRQKIVVERFTELQTHVANLTAAANDALAGKGQPE